MALSGNGKISVSDIQREMDATEGNAVSLSTLANQWKAQTGDSRFNPPHKMSDWRGQTWVAAHSLSISPGSVNLIRDGGTFTINVTSNVRWTASQTDGTGGITSLSPTTLPGNGTITVTVNRNDGQDSRGGTITITTGQVSRTFTWAQEGGSVIGPPDGGGGSGPGRGGSGGGNGGDDGSGGGGGDENPGLQ